ncbi:MAG: hypothetical protein ACK4YX_12090 [Rhabdaerophilum calidifontis]
MSGPPLLLATTLLLACLAVLVWLFFAAGVLFGLAALRARFDSDLALTIGQGALGAGLFFLTALSIHLIRHAIIRRAGLNRFDKLDG